MSRAQIDHPLQTPAIEESIRAEARSEGVPPPETPFRRGEQARQTASIGLFIGIALVIAGLLLAVFSL